MANNILEELDQLLDEGCITEETDTTSFTEQQQKFNAEKLNEQKQRRKYRGIMFWCFFGLLVGQHALLVAFVTAIIINGAVLSLQPLLTVIIPATLGETYIVMRQMVEFIFQPGDYKPEK